ncbi:glycosyltransferase [Flavivirga algicola]|uniref:Glycosyltransferase n=1 Tax=Flavivirga algicola TaxID=2729136 RepID=A0ABX1RS27_9FLAO|nr:glycosyltransferase [Flavivirga algicola]NMH86352.1 glycosyltransferase [Flavivirga algicola]
MKVVQISTSSRGGAGIAALRLHHALRQVGVESAFVSKNYTIGFDGVAHNDAFFEYKRPSLFKRFLLKIKRSFYPSIGQRINKEIESKKHLLKYEMLSVPYTEFELHKHPILQQADVINFHWVGGVLSYNTFFKNNKTPIVFTLHDMNPFKGLFHYQQDEIRNRKHIKVLDNSLLILKKNAISIIKKGALITPSKWLLDEAKTSNFYNHFHALKCIPNAIDFNVFKIQNKVQIRKEKGISENEFVLLFVADKDASLRKGVDLLVEGLELLKNIKCTLLVLGSGVVKADNINLKIVPLGFVGEVDELASYYAAADVFILPSIEDNLPNVMLESFACGTPVISFKTGGMDEHVINNITGVKIEDITGESLVKAIQQFYENINDFKPEIIREYAIKHFSYNKQAEAYKEVYKELMA